MAQQTINIGTTANDGTGDPLRTAFDKVNSNFTELYNDESQGEVNSIIAGDGISVDTATGNVTVTNTITNNNQLTNGAGYVDGSGTANYVPKWTDGDTIGNSVIYDDGTNVGIGTNNPSSAGGYTKTLQVSDANASSIGVSRTSGTTSSIEIGTFSGSNMIDSIGSGIPLRFKVDAAERMRLHSTGDISFRDTSANEAFYWDASTARLGLGTTSPAHPLEVTVNVGGLTDIAFLSNDNVGVGNSAGLLFAPSNGIAGARIEAIATEDFSVSENRTADLAFYTRLNGTLAERMRLDASGRLGIGTNNPVSEFVVSNSGSEGYEIRPNGSANGGAITLSFDRNAGTWKETAIAASQITFNINGSSSEAMRIDTDGNVGIGTSSPSAKFNVRTANTIAEDVAHFGNSNINDGLAITTNGNLDWGLNARNSRNLTFATNQTERMRITDGGQLAINTVGTGNHKLAVVGDLGTNDVVLFKTRADFGNYSFFNSSGTQVGYIQTNSTSTSYVTSSDYRLKENVVPMTGALNRVDALKPSRFNFIADAETTVDGFLAHELAEVIPEAVTGEKDATEEYEVTPAVLDEEGNVIEEAVMGIRDVYQGIDQSKIVPLLTAALQEANQMIKDLTTRIETLENN